MAAPGMSRDEALRALAQLRGDRIVVSTMQVVTPWHVLSPSPLNMTCVGFMGGASTLALGTALARPDRKVVVLDGDGSLLMQLGSLATIAGAAPRNFHHILFQNGVYETSGGQPTAAANRSTSPRWRRERVTAPHTHLTTRAASARSFRRCWKKKARSSSA